MSIDSLAAKRALTSAGIVGGTSVLLSKGLGLKFEMALGTALASSLIFDFYVNKSDLESSVVVAKTEMGRHIREEDALTGNTYSAAVVAGCVALLAGATILLGSYAPTYPYNYEGGGGRNRATRCTVAGWNRCCPGRVASGFCNGHN